jgi:ribosomal protein S17E
MKNNGKSDDYKKLYKDKFKENKKLLKKIFNSLC